jgi:hypothetical protein
MAASPLRDQLIHEIDKLSPAQQEQILLLARSLTRPRGVPGQSLLKYAGRIPLDEVEKMEKAIEDFERIDFNEW